MNNLIGSKHPICKNCDYYLLNKDCPYPCGKNYQCFSLAEHDKQIKADERNNVLSTLSKLIDSDYNSKECKLLLADLCEMLLEQLKENSNECKHNEDGECFSKWDCVYKQADLNPDGTVNIYKCGKEQSNDKK